MTKAAYAVVGMVIGIGLLDPRALRAILYPIFSQRRATSPYRSSNRRNHQGRTRHGPRHCKPYT